MATFRDGRNLLVVELDAWQGGFSPVGLFDLPEFLPPFGCSSEEYIEVGDWLTRDEALARVATLNRAKVDTVSSEESNAQTAWHVAIQVGDTHYESLVNVQLNGTVGSVSILKDLPVRVALPSTDEAERLGTTCAAVPLVAAGVAAQGKKQPATVTSSLPPLQVELVKNGAVVRVAKIPDPRNEFIRIFNEINADSDLSARLPEAPLPAEILANAERARDEAMALAEGKPSIGPMPYPPLGTKGGAA